MSSIYTDILGVIPKNKKYDEMLQVFDACNIAGIEIPETVVTFFHLGDFCEGHEPSRDGMEVDLKEITDLISKDGDEDWEDGATYDIDVSKLPTEVKIIRFKIGID